MEHVAEHASHALEMGLHAFLTLPFWFAAAGVVLAWYFYLKNPRAAVAVGTKLAPLKKLLDNKYYFDWFNENVIARACARVGCAVLEGRRSRHHRRRAGQRLGLVGERAGRHRARVQTGFLYTYAFWMVIGLALLLGWVLLGAR